MGRFIPVPFHHYNICKPNHRREAIYAELVRFIADAVFQQEAQTHGGQGELAEEMGGGSGSSGDSGGGSGGPGLSRGSSGTKSQQAKERDASACESGDGCRDEYSDGMGMEYGRAAKPLHDASGRKSESTHEHGHEDEHVSYGSIEEQDMSLHLHAQI